MRRIVFELPIVAIAAAMMASVVLIAGTAMEASTEPIVLSYAFQPALCTVSYCEPAELVVTSVTPFEPPIQATTATPEED